MSGTETEDIRRQHETALEPLEIIETTTRDNMTDNSMPGYKLALLIIAISSSVALIGLDTSILATVIPKLTNDFHTITDIAWYSAAFRLASCSFQFAYGRMYTVFRLKPVFVASVLIFELGSLISAVAPDSKTFIFGRAICGLGAAGIYAGGYATIRQVIPLRYRSIFASIGGAIEGVSEITGPLLGGILADKLSWRWCFYINLPIGAVSILINLLFLPSPELPESVANLNWKAKLLKLDLLSTAFFIPSIACLLMALQWGGTKFGWTSAQIIVLFAIFAVFLAIFAFQQYRKQDKAVLPPRILKQRTMIASIWFLFNINACVTIITYYLPIYFQTVQRASASKSGILILPSIIGFIVACIFSGCAVPVLGYYTVFAVLAAVLTPIATGLLTTLDSSTSIKSLIGYLSFFGIACGLGYQIPQIATQTALNTEDAIIGQSALLFAQAFSPAIFNFAAQNLFVTKLKSSLRRDVVGMNSTAIDSMGLTDLIQYLDVAGPTSSEQMDVIMRDYSHSLTDTFMIPTVLASLLILGALSMEWRSVKAKQA